MAISQLLPVREMALDSCLIYRFLPRIVGWTSNVPTSVDGLWSRISSSKRPMRWQQRASAFDARLNLGTRRARARTVHLSLRRADRLV